MDIQLFKTFLEVAKLNNITQAAEQLNFTQPAITAQIHMLEDHYGIALFERIGKKLYITEAGQELTVYAEKLLAAYQDTGIAMQRFSQLSTPVNVGASTTAASYILSPVLLAFKNRETAGKVSVDICPNLPTTIKGLIENEFDIVIVHNNIGSNQILQFDLYKEKLVLVASRDLVAANNHCLDMTQYPFINFRPGCIFRTKFEEAVKEKDIHPAVMEYSDAEAIKQAVLEGVGASLLPLVLVEPFIENGTLIELTDAPRLTFVMSVAFHKNKVLTPVLRALLLIFAEHANMPNDLTAYLDDKS